MAAISPKTALAFLAVACAAVACGGAAKRANGPFAASARQCQPPEETTRALLLAWDPAARAALETGISTGVAVVHYDGCTLELLEDCRLAGRYDSEEAPRSSTEIALSSEDEILDKLPIAGGELVSLVHRGGALSLDYATASTETAKLDAQNRGMLRGRCDRATHFVRAMVRGAYSIGAENGASDSRGRVVRRGGDLARCLDKDVSADDSACRAIVQVALTPISELTSDRNDLYTELGQEVSAISDMEEALRTLQNLMPGTREGEVRGPAPAEEGASEISRGIARIPDGGSDAWDAAVLPILVAAFDKNGSSDIDSMDEIAAIPCDVLSALDAAIKKGRGAMTALRTTYGFAKEFLWVGGSLGFDEKIRPDADARLANCGL